MSRGPENTFISAVHRHLPVDLYRMKNHNEYAGGIADCWYSGPSADLWVEYKFVDVPKRPTTMIDLTNIDKYLTTLQQEWLVGRYGEGRNVGVIAGSKDGGVWFPGLTWQSPISAGVFVSRLQSRKQIAEQITEIVHG